MFNKENLTKIIRKYGDNYGSGMHHIYIKYNEEEAIEEEAIMIIAHETILEVCGRDDGSSTYIPYSQIWEISIVSDSTKED